MLKFAIGELGLMPWEFKDMTFQEYQLYSHGYFLRADRAAAPIRRLYMLIFNSKVPVGKQLISPAAIINHWPLLIDNQETVRLNKEEMQERLNKAKALTAQQRLKAHGNK